MTFLKSQPNGSIRLNMELAPAVESFLQAVGFPGEEAERLVRCPEAGEKELTWQELEACWARLHRDYRSNLQPGQAEPASLRKGARSGSAEGREGLGSRITKEHWQRLEIPQEMIPRVRLALARLGASPEDLGQLEEEAKDGSLTLAETWQVLRQAHLRSSPSLGSEANGRMTEGVSSVFEWLWGSCRLGEEAEEWRRILLETGLAPDQVRVLIDARGVRDQEELRQILLSLAPREDLKAEENPKPLYVQEGAHPGLHPPLQEDRQGKGLTGKGSREPDRGASWAPEGRQPLERAAAEGGEDHILPLQPFQVGRSPEPGLNLKAPPPSEPRFWASWELREALWNQVRTAIVEHLGPGESRVNLTLNPPELGQLQLTLRLTGQQVAVLAMASRPEVAEWASQGVQHLVQALAHQGLVLTSFQVVPLTPGPGPSPAGGTAGNQREGSHQAAERRSQSFTFRSSREVDRFV